MFVIFIHGPVAAGKRTIGFQLSEKTGLPLFHNHLTVDLARTLFGLFTEPFITLRARIWKAAFEEAARADQSFIFTFTPEASVDPALIDELVRAIEIEGGRVFFVELMCSRDVIMSRLAHADRSNKLNDPAEFERAEQEGVFAFPAMPEPAVTIDTNELQPHESVEAIREAIPELA